MRMILSEWLKNGWLIEHKTSRQEIGHLVTKNAHHYRVIESLRFTLNSEDKLIRKLDAFRKKRNLSEYNHAGAVTAVELGEIVVLAEDLRKSVESWIMAQFPSLL
jgi:hypothetical protein